MGHAGTSSLNEPSQGGDGLDAAAIMHEIRSQVRRQPRPEATGEFPSAGRGEGLTDLRRRILQVGERWHVRELPFDSPTPIIGPILAALRSALNSVAAKWHVRRILLQQNALNFSVFQSLQGMALELERQAEAIAGYEDQLQRLAELVETQKNWTETRVAELETHNEAQGERSRALGSWQLEQSAWRERQNQWNRMLESKQDQLWQQLLAGWNQQVRMLLGGLGRERSVAYAPRDEERTQPASSPRAEKGWDYLAFNREYTGSSVTIKEMYRQYLPLFVGLEDVLDLGCGQGHFLELLAEVGVRGYGVDADAEMVAVCRAKGLRAEQGEGLSHVASLDPASLDGIFAGHLIEHLDAVSLHGFLAAAYLSLRPGGILVCETPNTASLYVMANTYYRDPTHQRPVHPETYEFLARAHRFSDVELRYSSPVPFHVSVPPLPSVETLDPVLEHVVAEIGARFERIDRQLSGCQNVALIACKPMDAAS